MSHREDVETLLDALVPFAQRMLKQHRAFYPFGGHIRSNGELVLDGAHSEDERPLSEDVVDTLMGSFRKRAANHELRACAVVHDIRTTPPGSSAKEDAICASVDHRSGYSAHIIYPYRFTSSGELAIEDAFALRGEAAVFERSEES